MFNFLFFLLLQNISTQSAKLPVPAANVKSSVKTSVASISPEKPNLAAGKAKLKLPMGVVPIPIIIDSKLENEEKKRNEIRRSQEAVKNSPVKDPPVENVNREKAKSVDIGNLENPVGNRHGGQVNDRQGNEGWPRVRPGVQEIGDEPNHLERLAG